MEEKTLEWRIHLERQGKKAIIGMAVALIVIVVALGVALVKKYTPGKERLTLSDYYTVASDEAIVILQGKTYEKTAKIQDGLVYLDLETIQKFLNTTLYYDGKENVLTVTTPTEIIQAYANESQYYSNKTKVNVQAPIVRTIDGKPYLSVEFVVQYSDFQYAYYTMPNRLLLWNEWVDVLCYDAKKDTALRVNPDIKSEIVDDITKTEKLYYVDANGQEGRKFVKVMTEDGLFGFVKKSDLTDSYYITLTSQYVEPEYVHITRDEKIVLGWHVVTNMQANNYLENMVANNDVLTVISPTWFRLTGIDGSISSLASSEYVTKAHALGLEVWGLIDNFDPQVSSYEVLSSTVARERLVNALIAEAIKYDLDGLNIDFEELTLETGVHFVQFLKELSVKCRANGIVLSVDNYVPFSYTAYYDLKTQGKVVDYVVIMAYDEHHSGSEQAGSVASIGYVEQAIKNTCELVPNAQIIMGMPFYTRLWQEKTENGQTKVSSETKSMYAAETELSRYGVTAMWDETTKQYYAEYEQGGSVYKMWLEEEDSIREKLARISDAKLAGTALWRLELEKDAVWDVIRDYAN